MSQARFRKVPRSTRTPSQNSPELKVWKSIKLGVGPTNATGFLHQLKVAKIIIYDTAKDIMSKPEFTVSDEEREVDLVVVSLADLGFKQGARFDRICQRARRLGLKLCPPDVGPQLRLQHRDQPVDDWMLIGMEPITDSGDCPRVFLLGHGCHGLLVSGFRSDFVSAWAPDESWVFVRPRK